MLRRVLLVLVDERKADHTTVLERDERKLAHGERTEVALPPLLERPARVLLAARDVGVGLERDRVRAPVVLGRERNDLDPGGNGRLDHGRRELEEHILHPAALLVAARRVVRERVGVVVARDAVEPRLAEAAGMLGRAPVQRRPNALAAMLPRRRAR